MTDRPLAGIRVVEVAQNLAGPYCARILADLGAEVVKVEPPQGDAARNWGPPFHRGVGTIFAFANTGKEAVRLDLKTEEGRARLRELIRDADVLVESLRPGVATELGLGWEAVHADNPSLLYLSVLAYGEEGPLRELPGYEPLMQAHGGLLSYTGPKGGEPVRVGTSVVDMGTGMWGVIGLLAALRERDRTGRGARLSVALFDTALTWSGYHLLGAHAESVVPGPLGTELGMIAPYGTFPTADGAVMVAVGTDALFRKLCEALELGPLWEDARYAHNPERVAHRDDLNERVSTATERLASAELIDLLRAHGAPVAPVRNVGEILEDPQFHQSGLWDDRENLRLPLRIDGLRIPVAGPLPSSGQS